MWRSFWSTVRHKAARSLPPETRLKLLDRAVRPILDFHCTRWPCSTQVSIDIDTLQRKMIRIALGDRKQPHESPEAFVRIAGRAAGVVAARHGLWSARHSRRVLDWEEHLLRDRNFKSWASRLYIWRDRAFLMHKRAAEGGPSIAGRTGTRAKAGRVPVRWHDGVANARIQSSIAAEGATSSQIVKLARTAQLQRRATM